MIEATSGTGLIMVTGILAGVGISMFLLPPVPGVPVYLTVGIVLAATGHEILGEFGTLGSHFVTIVYKSQRESRRSCSRLGWIDCIFYRCLARIEAYCECDATEIDWREPFPLCVSAAGCYYQLHHDEGDTINSFTTRAFYSKGGNPLLWTWYVLWSGHLPMLTNLLLSCCICQLLNPLRLAYICALRNHEAPFSFDYVWNNSSHLNRLSNMLDRGIFVHGVA